MQEKNHKSSSSNGGVLLSVFFLTFSLVNLQDIYRLQWLGEHETRGRVFDPRLLQEDCRENEAKAAFMWQCSGRLR